MPDIRRVFARVSGSPGSGPALRQAADLARHHGAVLIPLHTWVPPEGDLHERKHLWPAELRQLWAEDAWQPLWDALDAAFGGLPAGITTQPVVLGGKPGPVLTGAARRAGDLLVIGAGRRGLRRRLGWWGGRPLLPGPRLLPGAGHPAPGAGPARRARRARLAVPAPLAPGHDPPAAQATPPCPGRADGPRGAEDRGPAAGIAAAPAGGGR